MVPDKLLVSVVIPARNEESSIAQTSKEVQRVLQDCHVDYELIVVDDGSLDGTFCKVRDLGEHNNSLKAIRLSRNFGKESALLAGMEAAKGDVVITMDADMQHPPGVIPQMLEKCREGIKVVNAVKRSQPHDGLVARGRTALFNVVLSVLGGIELHNTSDFKLLDSIAVQAIVGQLRERRRFYRGLTDWIGFEQVSVPFDVAGHNQGKGKLSLVSLLDIATTAMTSFTNAPLRLVTILGMLTLIFGFFVTVDALWSHFQGAAVSGFATTIIAVLLLGSFIMISLGIIGEYIGKIYEEIKGRPAYLVEDTYGIEDYARRWKKAGQQMTFTKHNHCGSASKLTNQMGSTTEIPHA